MGKILKPAGADTFFVREFLKLDNKANGRLPAVFTNVSPAIALAVLRATKFGRLSEVEALYLDLDFETEESQFVDIEMYRNWVLAHYKRMDKDAAGILGADLKRFLQLKLTKGVNHVSEMCSKILDISHRELGPKYEHKLGPSFTFLESVFENKVEGITMVDIDNFIECLETAYEKIYSSSLIKESSDQYLLGENRIKHNNPLKFVDQTAHEVLQILEAEYQLAKKRRTARVKTQPDY